MKLYVVLLYLLKDVSIFLGTVGVFTSLDDAMRVAETRWEEHYQMEIIEHVLNEVNSYSVHLYDGTGWESHG